MLAMALPMVVLFELAIQIARVVDKRRARREAAEHFHGLSDDEASPLDARPSALDADPSALEAQPSALEAQPSALTPPDDLRVEDPAPADRSR
jgi:sec-independent protein translocase protein TatC